MNFGVLQALIGGFLLFAALLMSWPENKKKTRRLAVQLAIIGAVWLSVGLAVLAA